MRNVHVLTAGWDGKSGIANLSVALVVGSSAASMVKNGKPAPDLFLLAAARLGLAPARCVVVEDAEAGVAAAAAGGMRCIGIGDPARLGDQGPLLGAGAVAIRGLRRARKKARYR